MKNSNIVVLDGYTANPGDLDWSEMKKYGKCTIHDRTSPEQVVERSTNANILIINKVRLTRVELERLPKLKFISISATGYDNVDIEAAIDQGIAVSNVRGYSTPSVAQHVFALIFTLLSRVQDYNNEVKDGRWSRSPDFTFHLHGLTELNAKTLGLLGFGKIAQEVAKIGRAFGMEVLAARDSNKPIVVDYVSLVTKEELFSKSDILSLHTPLNPQTEEIINENSLSCMKPSCILINTARGGLIHEMDLRHALDHKIIAGVGLDVLGKEPPPDPHPLINAPNCIITPHVSWATIESRRRLINETIFNVKAFTSGSPRNVIT